MAAGLGRVFRVEPLTNHVPYPDAGAGLNAGDPWHRQASSPLDVGVGRHVGLLVVGRVRP